MNDEDSIDRFSEKYITEKRLVKMSLEHIQLLELYKNRKREENLSKVQEEENKQYEEIDWDMHFKSNTFKKLKVTTVNKYLENNNLKEFLKLKKNEKCNLISHQIALGHLKSNINWEKDNEKEIEDSTSNVIDEHLDSDDSDSETDDEEGDIVINCAERIVVLRLKKMMMMMMAVILIVRIQTVTFAQLKMKMKMTMIFQIYLLQLEVDDPLQLGDVHILNVRILINRYA